MFPLRLVLLLAPLGLFGCSALTVTKVFSPVADLATPPSRSLAEGGHGQPVSLPPGVRLSGLLEGHEEEPLAEASQRRFEFHLQLIDDRQITNDSQWSLAPVIELAELVDDEGQRFTCSRASFPVDSDTLDSDSQPRVRDYVLVFDLPVAYRFRAITYATVHWTLAIDSDALVQISSRFRS